MIGIWSSRRRLRVPVLDFAAGPAHPRALAWLLLAVGVLAILASAGDLLAARERLQQEQLRVDRWQNGASGARAAASRTARSAVASTATDGAPAQAVVRSLQHPWLEVLVAVEAATPLGLHWTAFDHDAARPELRLEGVAGNAAAVFAAVEALALQPGMTAVVLTRLDGNDRDRADERSLRFEVGVTLATGRPLAIYR